MIKVSQWLRWKENFKTMLGSWFCIRDYMIQAYIIWEQIVPLRGKMKNEYLKDTGIEELTGGPSSGGIMILRFPPGLMSRIPSSNPELFCWFSTISIEHKEWYNKLFRFPTQEACLELVLYFLVELWQVNLVDKCYQYDGQIHCIQYSEKSPVRESILIQETISV